MENKLPKGWVHTSLGEVCKEINSGSGFPKIYQGMLSGDYPFAKVGDLSKYYRSGKKIIDSANNYISENQRQKIKARIFPEGTIVFPKIGEALKGNYRLLTKREMLFDNNVMGVTPDSSIANPEFIYYFLLTQDFGRFSVATAVPSVRRGDVESIELLLPDLCEQQRIVAKIEELFSELDSGIASLKTARDQLKIYRQALLKHAFEGKLTEQWRKDNANKLETPEQLLARIQIERETRYQQQLDEWKQAVKDWEAKGKEGKRPSKPAIHKPLSRISAEELEVLPELPKEWSYIRLAEIAAINSGMSVSKNRKLADPIEVNYLRVANVQRGYLDLSEIKSMNIEMVDLPRLQLEINDVLFNEGGDLDKLGRGWIWEGQVSQCITQNHVFRASPFVNEKYHAKFISYWGNSFGRDYFESGGKQTTNLASINKTVLSNFPIPLTSFTEQKEIVNQLEEKLSIIEQNEKEIEKALAKAELLRQSILKKAFSGKLILTEE